MDTVLESRSGRVIIGPDRPFVVIGERLNPTGRKSLAAELTAGNLERVRADAEAQVAAGATVLDVNVGLPGADEAALMAAVVKEVQAVVDVPLTIDSSVADAIAAALEVCEGKPLVNSVTAAEEHLERLLPLVRRHGAAVIGLAYDESGISADPEARLAAARRIVERAADAGIPAADVVIDPLAMAVATDSQAARTTLETIRRVRQELGCNLTLGASNVSFGLPARKWLNSAFLSAAMVAGLTSAIANPLSVDSMRAVGATDVLLGRDPYAAGWISQYREGRLSE